MDVARPFSKDPFKYNNEEQKIYIADPGIAIAEAGISTLSELSAYNDAPLYDTIWESIVLAHLRAWLPCTLNEHIFFSHGKKDNGIDFIITQIRDGGGALPPLVAQRVPR
ncbi:MAG: DUF4143 domain-containing protein [Desulfovibrio sp.]|nr:DUF4143 domain-containing protein [Desulfovibrio sp.]